MASIQALNVKKSPRQQPYRVTVWAGSENAPGARSEWVIYSTSVHAAIGLAARSFRRGAGKNRRWTDWTVNVEPVRGGETIIPVDGRG